MITDSRIFDESIFYPVQASIRVFNHICEVRYVEPCNVCHSLHFGYIMCLETCNLNKGQRRGKKEISGASFT